MTDIAAIAKGLTKAQAKVLRLHAPSYGGRDTGWPGSATRDDHSFAKAGRPMMDAGLIAWTNDPRSSRTVITPRGKLARQHLQEQGQ